MRLDTGRLRVLPSPVSDLTVAVPDGPGGTDSSDASESASELEAEASTAGAYIRIQRERRGISLDQLAAATKISRAQLQLLESDRFDEMPGLVFAKGFLRCAARELDLDPEHVMALLYEQEQAQLRSRRRESSAAHPEVRGTPGPATASAGSGAALLAAFVGLLPHRWTEAIAAQLPDRPAVRRLVLWALIIVAIALVVMFSLKLASGPVAPYSAS